MNKYKPHRKKGSWTSAFLWLAVCFTVLFSMAAHNTDSALRASSISKTKLALSIAGAIQWPFHPTNKQSASNWIWHIASLTVSELSFETPDEQPNQTAIPLQTSTQAPKIQPAIAWSTLLQQESNHSQVKRVTVGWVLDSGAQTLLDDMQNTPGLTVLAPKWFHVDGSNGALSGNYEPAVINRAKALGIQVWAVVDNGFNGPMTHDFLQYKNTQDQLIAHLVHLAKVSGVNGINLDFEGLLQEDRWNFARFVTVLGSQLHKLHKSLSVDLPPDYVSGQNNDPYNHKAIAKAANDVILMGYDQYWQGDATAGPTASLPWVQSSIADMLNTGVPADKLILGVPFYTQDWTLDSQGQVQSSSALSLWQVRTILATKHIHTIWEPQLGLRFGRYKADGVTHEIWVEDDRSLLLTLQLIARAHLAGAAAWYLGLEYPSTWLSLVDSVHSAIA